MKKSNLFELTIVMIYIWRSHVYFEYWKIEAFWENELFSSLLWVMAKFSLSCCLLPWPVWFFLEAFIFWQEEGRWNTRGLRGRIQSHGGLKRESQRLSMSLPHCFPVSLKFVFLETRGAKRKGNNEDQERQS